MTRFVLRWSFRNHSGRLVPPLSPTIERSLTSVRRQSMPTRRYVIATALSLALVACSGSGSGRSDDPAAGGSSSSTTTATGVTSTTAAPDPKALALDGYRAYWAVVNAYGAEDKPFDPDEFKARFSPVTTGAQYDSLFQRFQLNRAQGLVYRGGEGDQLRPRVVDLSGDRAEIEDCADDTGGIFSTRDNAFTQDTTPGQHSLIRAVLKLDRGTWKVSTQDGGDQRCTL